MKSKKRENFYFLALSFVVILFAASVVLVYRYLSDNIVISDAASEWVAVDLTNTATINTAKTTAFWNKTAAYIEAAQNNDTLSRIVYAPEVHYGGTLMVSPDYDNDQTMISCSYYGCFKTSNAGNSWKLVVDDYGVLYVKESPNYINDGIVIALGWFGVYRSDDFGETWTKIRDNIYSSSFGNIQFSPDFVNDDTIYLTKGGDGLYQSLDTGLTWSKVGALSAAADDTLTIVISPDYVNDDTLWVNARGVGVYKSTDRGSSWATANTGIVDTDTGILAISPDYVNDSTLFITGLGDSNRIYKSTNGATSWADIGAGISNDAGHILWKVFISPDFINDQRVIVTDFTGRRSWYSDDAGGTWMESNLSSMIGEKRAVNKMEVDASIVASSNYVVDKTLWMVTLNEKGFLKSIDGGETWTSLDIDNQGYFTSSSPDVQYASDYESSNEIWVIDYYLGPMVSVDNGNTWESRINGLEKYSVMPGYDDIYMENIFFSNNYENDNTLFVFYGSVNNTDKFIYKSTDRGLTWVVITFPVSLSPWLFSMDFSPDYVNDNKIVLGIGWEGLFESTDQGDTWAAVGTFPADRINDIKFGVNANEYIVAVYNNSLFYTDDDGANFTARSVGGAPIVKLRLDQDYINNGKFYTLSYENEFAEITDKGATVSIKNTEITDLNYHGGRDIVLSPNYSSDELAYASGMESIYPGTGLWPASVANVSGQKGFLYKTEDAGVNWTQIDYNFIHSILEIEGHAISPYFIEGEGQYLATKNEGLYRSFSYQTTMATVESTILKESTNTINKIRVVATESNLSSGNIDYYVSTNGGNHWTLTPNNEEVIISDHPGNKLVWRASIKSNDGLFSPRIESVEIFYDFASGSSSSSIIAQYNSSPNVTINPSNVLSYNENQENFVDLEIFNETYDEVIISNHEDLLYDGLNKDSGTWINFNFENVYENWELEGIDNSAVYMRFRRAKQAGYIYSGFLVIPAVEVSNSQNLTAEVKSYQEENPGANLISQGFGSVKDFPNKIRYACPYNHDKFSLIPYLRNDEGQWFAGQLEKNSLSTYEFTDLPYQVEVTIKAIAENTNEIIVNRMDEEGHYELWLRQIYDNLVIREDFVLADTWIMYQEPMEKEVLLADLCRFLRTYKNNNYIELYSQPNYQGFKQSVYSNEKDFSHEFIGDNNIASIKSFGNIAVKVYSSANYKGKSFDLLGDVNNFNGTVVGNDNISSLKLIYLPSEEIIEIIDELVVYAEASEDSEIMEEALSAGEYEIIWEKNNWYKINLGNKREAWFYQNN